MAQTCDRSPVGTYPLPPRNRGKGLVRSYFNPDSGDVTLARVFPDTDGKMRERGYFPSN